MSRSRQSTLNFIAQFGSSAILMITSIVATPWILRYLGVERFGASRTMYDILGYLGLLDLGMGLAVRAEMVRVFSLGDLGATLRTLATSFRIYIGLGLLMTCAGLGLVATLPFLLHLDHTPTSELLIAGAVLLLPTLLVPTATFRSLAEAMNISYLPVTIVTFQLFSAAVMAVIFAHAGFGLIGQASATALAQVPTAIGLSWFIMRRFPDFWHAKPDPEMRRRIWSMNWPNLLYTASTRVGLVSDNIVIASMLNPAAVSPFYLTQRLAFIVQGQLQSVGNATWAALVQLHVAGDKGVFRERMLQLTSLVSGLGVAVLTPVVIFNPAFVAHWFGPTMYGGFAVNLLCAINAWLYGLTSLWAFPIYGAGLMRQLSGWTALAMSINVVCSVAATYFLGPPGPLVGTLVGFVTVTCWAYTALMRQHFGISLISVWLAALKHLAWGVGYGVVLWLIARAHSPRTIIELMIALVISGSGGMLLFLLGLGRPDRRFWTARVRTMLGKNVEPVAA